MTSMTDGDRLIITLDGPAASGKSSVAKALARRLGIAYVSSGLLYRAATDLTLRSGVDPADEAAVLRLLARHVVRLHPDQAGNRVTVDDVDVTAMLHTDDVDEAVSDVARHDRVRVWVTDRLREMRGSFAIDGRDMGTVVFPGARWKFYLTAPAEVRAARRVGERAADLGTVAAGLRARDERDAKQSVAASDATVIDTGPLTLDEVVERVLAVVLTSAPESVVGA